MRYGGQRVWSLDCPSAELKSQANQQSSGVKARQQGRHAYAYDAGTGRDDDDDGGGDVKPWCLDMVTIMTTTI